MSGLGLGIALPFESNIATFDPIAYLRPFGLTAWWDPEKNLVQAGNYAVSLGDQSSADATKTLTQNTDSDRLLIVNGGTPSGRKSLRLVDNTDFMATTAAPTSLITVAAHTIWCVFKSPPSSTSAPQIIGDSNARVSLQWNTTGPAINPLNYDGGYDFTSHAAAYSTWYVFEWRHEAGSIYSRVNGTGEQSALSGNLTALGTTWRIRPTLTGNLAGAEVATIITCNQAVPLTQRNRISTYLRLLQGI